jgi:hypothetical protein
LNAAVTITPAAAVDEAHAVLHLAINARWPEDGAPRDAVCMAVARLCLALSGCQQRVGDPDAAELAARHADSLIKIMAAYCGTEDETKNAAGVTA